MRSLAKLMRYFIALIFVLQILSTAVAKPVKGSQKGLVQQQTHNQAKEIGRQASDGDSYEDSDEDDGEDDAELAQQSLLQQQQQQNLEESQEGSDEEDGGGGDEAGEEVRRRRRRDLKEMELEKPIEQSVEQQPVKEQAQEQEQSKPNEVIEKEKEQESAEKPVAAAAVETPSDASVVPQPPAAVVTVIEETNNSNPSLNRTSVLILIRDALKKVTTVLPTESVATNALQYFQLFEHFIQQTIEQVIDDYDEEEEEASTTAISFGAVQQPEKQQQQTIDEIANTNAAELPLKDTNAEENKVEQSPPPTLPLPPITSNTLDETVKVQAENKIEDKPMTS